MRPCRLRKDERGFTLIELLVTMVIVAVGMGGAIAMIDQANVRTSSTKQREAGTGLARELLEEARSVPYDRLTPNGLRAELQARQSLADATPSSATWEIERRDTTYTVVTQVCSIDDARDGFGDHSDGGFCTGQSGDSDRSPDDYKRVSVTLQWQLRGEVDRSVTQSAVIANESSTTGPDLAIVDQSPEGSEITSPVDSIRFDVVASEPPAAIRYLVDGVIKKVDNPSGTDSSFDWQIDNGPDGHLLDGTYVISATAFDKEGRPGATRSRTIKLNRDVPQAPSLYGGWNARVRQADFEWDRNPEPDVVGYRLYRSIGGGAAELVASCDVAGDPNAKACLDVESVATPAAYYLVALDSDPASGEPREGVPSAPVLVTPVDDQPLAPVTLAGAVSGSDAVLTWPPPELAGYQGAQPLFFRVYRDGVVPQNRIGRTTDGDDLSFRDTAVDGSHEYYVTTVDQSYSESDPVGPVRLP